MSVKNWGLILIKDLHLGLVGDLGSFYYSAVILLWAEITAGR